MAKGQGMRLTPHPSRLRITCPVSASARVSAQACPVLPSDYVLIDSAVAALTMIGMRRAADDTISIPRFWLFFDEDFGPCGYPILPRRQSRLTWQPRRFNDALFVRAIGDPIALKVILSR